LLSRVIRRLGRVSSLMVRLQGRDVSITSFADDIALVITGTNIFIEECSVATFECVLLPIVMAIMINLALSLRVCVVSAGVFVAAVKAGVGLGHGDGQRLDRLDLVWPLLQEDWAHWLGGQIRLRLIGGGGGIGVIGRRGVVIARRVIIGSGLNVGLVGLFIRFLVWLLIGFLVWLLVWLLIRFLVCRGRRLIIVVSCLGWWWVNINIFVSVL